MRRPAVTLSFTVDDAGLGTMIFSQRVGGLRRALFGNRDPLIDLRVLYILQSADGRYNEPVAMGAGQLRDTFDFSTTRTAMAVSRSRPAVMQLLTFKDGKAYISQGAFPVALPAGTYTVGLTLWWADGSGRAEVPLTVTQAGNAQWVGAKSIDL